MRLSRSVPFSVTLSLITSIIPIDNSHMQNMRGRGCVTLTPEQLASGLSAVLPDGRAFGFEVRPVHEDGGEPWNEAFIYLDDKMHQGKVVKAPWLGEIIPSGEDAAVEIETHPGTTRIEGTTHISTFRISNPDISGLNLYQGCVRHTWDGQSVYGMLERSTVVGRKAPPPFQALDDA